MLDLLMTMSTFTNLKDERVPSPPPYNTTLRSRESSNLEPISTSPSTISTIQFFGMNSQLLTYSRLSCSNPSAWWFHRGRGVRISLIYLKWPSSMQRKHYFEVGRGRHRVAVRFKKVYVGMPKGCWLWALVLVLLFDPFLKKLVGCALAFNFIEYMQVVWHLRPPPLDIYSLCPTMIVLPPNFFSQIDCHVHMPG